jgi:mono/diheme cytochrome c family protein
MSVEDLLGVLQGSTDYRHDFSSVMGVDDLTDLANFLSEGLINVATVIDYSTQMPVTANVSNGEVLFTATCMMCHGEDGRQILIGGDMGLSNVVLDEPIQEIVHIIRSGAPGTPMPAAIVNGWDIQTVLDVWSYLRTLPTE